MLTFEQIKDLIEQVADRKLQGLELERSGFRLKIDGQGQPGASGTAPVAATLTPAPAAPAAPTAAPAPAPAAAPPGTPAADSAPAEPEEVEGHIITSPIVGTFYRSPSPEAQPFVKVGDQISQGQILCIVEAMKLMNEIEADVAGEVLEIYPENSQAVEYGEPLFRVRAS